MPHILHLPRELRDEIYSEVATHRVHSLSKWRRLRGRETIAYDPEDPETKFGDDINAYSTSCPRPALDGLMHTCRQIRSEIQATLSRLKICYKIQVRSWNKNGSFTPTWMYIPAVTDRVELVEVEFCNWWHEDNGDTVDERDAERDAEGGGPALDIKASPFMNDMDAAHFAAGVSMLHRFLERGVHFLSKKKRKHLTIGTFLVNLHCHEFGEVKEAGDADDNEGIAAEFVSELNLWLRGRSEHPHLEPMANFKRQGAKEEDVRFLFERIDKFVFSWQGARRKEWDLKAILPERIRNIDYRLAQLRQAESDQMEECSTGQGLFDYW